MQSAILSRRVRPGIAVMIAVVGFLGVSSASARAGTPRDGGLALCVGISNYSNLVALTASANDAATVGAALKASGGFRRVIALSDAASAGASGPRSLATRANIIDTLTLLSNNATRDDALVFFFSGHGLSHEGKAYIMPLDAEPTEVIDPDAGIPADEILAIMKKSRASSKLLLIDANSDAELFPGVGGAIEAPSADFTVIVSCDEGQHSVVDEARSLGLFAMAIEAALAGGSDANDDNALSGVELLAFLDSYMSDYCLDHLVGAGQNPQMRTGDPMLAVIHGVTFSGPTEGAPENAKTGDTAEEPLVASASDAADGKAEPEHDAALSATGGSEGAEPAAPEEVEIDDAELQRRLAAAAGLRAEGKRQEAFAAFMELTGYGLPEAEYQIADAYYFGAGAEQNYKKAEEWFIRAGDLGHAKAQEMLASMYWMGTGVPQDGQKAGKWGTLKGQIPPDAKPIVDKRRDGRAFAVAKVEKSDGLGDTKEENKDAVSSAAAISTPTVAPTVTSQPYQQTPYQQTYQQPYQPYQQQPRQYQRQYQDPNSVGMRMRRYFLGN